MVDSISPAEDLACSTESRFRVRYVPAAVLIGLGVLLVIWGIVSFAFSISEAVKAGTLSALVKWCGSCVLVGFVGVLFLASGNYVAKAKYKRALATICFGFIAVIVGAAILMPFIIEGPGP